MNNKLLQIDNADKLYSGVQVLYNVSFELHAGEVHALVGENGAGKSTLIKILMGITPRDAGEIYVQGEKVEIKNSSEAARLGIAAVFQELSQLNSLTVAENIFLHKEPRKGILTNRAEMVSKTKALIERYGITLDPEKRCSQLTTAEKQLSEILKAIASDPRILILDEPTSSLTERETDILFDIIRQYKEKGASIVYVSHRMDEIFKITDRVSVLRDGRNVDTIATKELNMERVVSMMVGRKLGQSEKREYSRAQKPKALEVKKLSSKGMFKDVSFSLYEGEILGITGLVGSGRTELMRILCGVDRYDDGEVLLYGQKQKFHSPKDAMKRGIAMVPESRHTEGLIMGHDIEDNLLLPNMRMFIKYGMLVDKKELTKFSQEQINLYSIKTESSKKLVRNLSGGNQQKVVLAKWLATNPKVLIVDEPTVGVDVGAKQEIYRVLKELAASGISIIMVSSDMTELLSQSDRILVMNRRRIIGEFTAVSQEEIMTLILRDSLGSTKDSSNTDFKSNAL